MQKFTKEQATIISGYTGIMACKFEHLQEAGQKTTTYRFMLTLFIKIMNALQRGLKSI
jgi:hypothetical protein